MSELVALIRALEAERYCFVTITPASHALVARRWEGLGEGLRDLFGWSRAVAPDSILAAVRAAAGKAGVLVERDGGIASTLRASTLCGRLFLHSAYPTSDEDSVFLGPDSYRFADLIARVMAGALSPASILDIGAGAGVGGICAAAAAPGATLTLTDINQAALRLADANACAAGLEASLVETSGTDGLTGTYDLALLNPPYLIDEGERAYRHGGGSLGTDLPLSLSSAAMERLAPGGRLILYSGSPIVAGEDAFHGALAAAAAAHCCALRYEELDPDVFGEELARAAYGTVDRIALIGAVCTKDGLERDAPVPR